MPVRKLKSCVHCRKAKARCSLSNPCSRCATRRLECQYATAPLRPERRAVAFRAIRPAAGKPGWEQVDQAVDSQHGASLWSESATLAPGEQSEEKNGSPGYPGSMGEGVQTNLTGTEADSCSLLAADPTFDTSLAFMPDPQNTLISPHLLDLEFSNLFPGLMTPASLDTPRTKSSSPQLSQRSRSLQEGSMTAKMIFSRVIDYSRLMAEAKSLPPFIHPPCCLGPGDECSPQSPHQCLPEPLAVCSNLCQMFYSRLPGSHDFIWKQICTHMRQMNGEVSLINQILITSILIP